MGTHHWEILARIFGIIQLLNLVSHSSTTSCYQFFSFSFFDYIYLLLPLSPSLPLSHSLSHTFGGVVMVCSSIFDMGYLMLSIL
jgi:hypothetical protein